MSTLTLTVIQSELHWENRDANLEMFERKIEGLRGKTEIVILPEMFSTGFSMNAEALAETMDGTTVAWMKRVATINKIILTGSIIINDPDENGNQYFNRLIWMLPNGQYGHYDKRHRFAYAGEHESYTSGHKRLIASVKGWRINLLICYDLRFPVWARQQVTETGLEYDLLVYVANWPDKRIHAWKTLLQARAIENQCYVVGVNRVGKDGNGINYPGDSMVINPMGEALYQKKGEEDIFTITLEKAHLEEVRTRFPFWKDADEFRIETE